MRYGVFAVLFVSIFGCESVTVAQTWAPNPDGFAGPVVVLVSPHTQSAAEHLVLTLQAANRVIVVGNPSAGANGNITGVLLPGAFGLTFTGLEVLQPDGSTFHGVGVLPDLTVPLSAAALANGTDPELDMALAFMALDP
jgi:C-terminal processing protease CtpA/Prc